ncbi:monocarboxylate transporter 10 [Heterodontus francisci]|uniref:monocarboxylate transporter 10 n=1 Tax=Heterodontus francisci TaxID=7792 RepID=UPI00355C0678
MTGRGLTAEEPLAAVPRQQEAEAEEGEKEEEEEGEGEGEPGSPSPNTPPLPRSKEPLNGEASAAADAARLQVGLGDGDHPPEHPLGPANTSPGPGEFVHPEGGWGWVVMFASMWCNGSVFGIQNAFGLLFLSLLETFGNAEDKHLRFKTAWVGSVSMGMIFFCSPIVSIFTDLYGCRKTATVGAAVAFVGLIASSFVKSLGPMYFTYGIIFGCGSSFAYQPSLVILGHYFKQRLGLVNGIVTAGSSVFTIVLPLLLKQLLPKIGLSHMLRVLSAFMFVLFLVGFTYKPLIPVDNKCSSKQKLNVKKIFNVKIWKFLGYRIWAFGIPTALFGYFVPYVHLMKYVEETFESTNEEVLLMCIGISSGIGRLIFGRVADYLPGSNKVFLQVASFFVIGLMSMMIPLCRVFGGLIAVCLFMGLFDGCFISIMAPIAFELVGSENVSQAIGFLLGLMSIPMTAGPPIAGFLRDSLGTYNLAFYLAGVPPMIGGAILCIIPWIQYKKLKRQEKQKASAGEIATKMLDHDSKNVLVPGSGEPQKECASSI